MLGFILGIVVVLFTIAIADACGYIEPEYKKSKPKFKWVFRATNSQGTSFWGTLYKKNKFIGWSTIFDCVYSDNIEDHIKSYIKQEKLKGQVIKNKYYNEKGDPYNPLAAEFYS